MLEFAIQYRVAIDAMTATRKFDLRKYELVPMEWNTARELRDVLKVSNIHSPFSFDLFTSFRPGFQGRNFIFLLEYPQSGHGHSSHGFHQEGPDYVVFNVIQLLPCYPHRPHHRNRDPG